ncbi:MAG: ATP-binding cassette domain-containing protein [Dehalococcoidia bacterium]|nr:ATP-binding cassette domain-containing protein [Dehalococcoidia bacterium]
MTNSTNGHRPYPRSVALVRISLEIRSGERVAILGPSGSGKTTLLHIMGGVIQPDQGSILINDRPLGSLRPGRELASLVGIIHQQFDLVPHLSVMHNVMAGRLGQWGTLGCLFSLVSPRERHLAVDALGKLGIADKLYERTSRLSGGEQQRVAMARLLVQTPKAILADEPVASLDPARAEDLMCLLTDIARESGKTLVTSLHSTQLVRTYFSRAIGLRNGELQFDLPVDAVTDNMLDALYNIAGLRVEG